MLSKTILAVAAAAAFLPATLTVVAPAQAQSRSGYTETYVDRNGNEYGQYRRGSSYQRGPGVSTGVGVGSDACSDPAYSMDPRCYSNR